MLAVLSASSLVYVAIVPSNAAERQQSIREHVGSLELRHYALGGAGASEDGRCCHE
jgi:hypothetical protein